MAEENAAEQAAESNGWEWGTLEIFGHRTHSGRFREEERFGAKMVRIDVPVDGDPELKGWRTHFYGGGAIFSLTLTDEAAAMRVNKPYQPPARYIAPPDRPLDGFEEDPE